MRGLRRVPYVRNALNAPMTRLISPSRSAWLATASRIVLAILGGYAFTYAATAALARLLPLDRYDSALVATLISFVVYLSFILWAFAVHSLRRVAASLLTTVPLALIGFWPQLMERLG